MAAARDQVTATIDGKPRRITKIQATAKLCVSWLSEQFLRFVASSCL